MSEAEVLFALQVLSCVLIPADSCCSAVSLSSERFLLASSYGHKLTRIWNLESGIWYRWYCLPNTTHCMWCAISGVTALVSDPNRLDMSNMLIIVNDVDIIPAASRIFSNAWPSDEKNAVSCQIAWSWRANKIPSSCCRNNSGLFAEASEMELDSHIRRVPTLRRQ